MLMTLHTPIQVSAAADQTCRKLDVINCTNHYQLATSIAIDVVDVTNMQLQQLMHEMTASV